MSWKAVDLGENEARQKAMDLNVVFDQYGERTNADRREVRPPVPVEEPGRPPANSTTGSANAGSGGAGYAAPTDTSHGFGPPTSADMPREKFPVLVQGGAARRSAAPRVLAALRAATRRRKADEPTTLSTDGVWVGRRNLLCTKAHRTDGGRLPP